MRIDHHGILKYIQVVTTLRTVIRVFKVFYEMCSATSFVCIVTEELEA